MAAVVKRSIKVSGACLFCIYVMGLIYFLFLSEEYGRGMEGYIYNYNLCPFREISRYLNYREILGTRTVMLNLAGNVIGFIPFGALLPIVARGVRKAWKTGLLSLEISSLIEICQLIFRVGCFDVDDMILNTLGGLMGYFLFWICSRWFRRLENR